MLLCAVDGFHALGSCCLKERWLHLCCHDAAVHRGPRAKAASSASKALGAPLAGQRCPSMLAAGAAVGNSRLAVAAAGAAERFCPSWPRRPLPTWTPAPAEAAL